MSEEYIIRSEKPSYEIPDQPVAQYVWNRLLALNGDIDCIINANTDTKLKINELMSKCNSISMALIDRQIVGSDLVMTFADNSLEHAIAQFATVLLGKPLYPITPITSAYELERLLTSLGAITLFISESKAEIVKKVLANNSEITVKSVIVLDNHFEDYLTFEQLFKEGSDRRLPTIPYFPVDVRNDICVMFQSSGTTGVPKTVMLSNRAFLANIMHFHSVKMVERPVFSHMTPFGCVSGVSFLFGYLTRGVSLVIYQHNDTELIFKSIDKYRVNFMYFPPNMGYQFINNQCLHKYDFSSLRYLFTGGSAFAGNIGELIVEKYGLYLEEGYGMTEYFPMTDFPNAEEKPGFIPGSCGKCSQNTEMKVIDLNTGLSLGPVIDGEICCRGPKMFSGYFNNPEATNEVIDSEGWLRTGDIGHYDRQNRFYITDRLKELIKWGTKQISPTELELFLLTHPCVAEVAVVGVRHQTENQWPRAYVKRQDNTAVTEEELQKYVSDNLNEAKRLRGGVVFVDSIPRTTIGKVNRQYFKRLVAEELITD